VDCGRIYKKRTNNNPAADSDDDASERDDFCGSYRILRDLMGLTCLQMSLLSLFVWVAG